MGLPTVSVGVLCLTQSRANSTVSQSHVGPRRVLHEPLGEPYYYGPERMSNRFTEEKRPEDFKKYAELTFAKVSFHSIHRLRASLIECADCRNGRISRAGTPRVPRGLS